MTNYSSQQELAAKSAATWVKAQKYKRQRAAEQTRRLVSHELQADTLNQDPLAHAAVGFKGSAIVLILLALIFHAGIGLALLAIMGIGESKDIALDDTRIEFVQIAVEPKSEILEVERKEEQEDLAPEKEIETVAAKSEIKDVRPAPPDPIDINKNKKEADEAPLTQSQRRVVGLNFESTVDGGGGPSFATGNTRMGKTAKRAIEATKIKKLTPQKYNKKAARIPGATSKFVQPKRIKPLTPKYPKLLQAQGVEGDVTVLVKIEADGHVSSVKVIKKSNHEGFNQLAVATAKKERYQPATKDGVSISYMLKFTYRFRLDDI